MFGKNFCQINEKLENSGLTLVELLIGMTLASIMIAFIAGAYWGQTKTARDQQMIIGMQQNMRSAMHFLQRDIIMAGYDGDDKSAPDATITEADPSGFEFEYVDETDNVVEVAYDLSGGDLQRDVDGSTDTVAENIENLEFLYTLDDDSQSTDPSDSDYDDIRSVGVSILVRTASEISASGGGMVYQSLSGTNWGPYNDGFQRQILKAAVICRNMQD